MSTAPDPFDSCACAVVVTVQELWPYPSPDPRDRGHASRHAASILVAIGTMIQDGIAILDECASGQLRGAVTLVPGARANDWLPAAVLEVLDDLASPVVAARVWSAVEEAVQQYDREKGALGDGENWQPPAVPERVEWQDGSSRCFAWAKPGTREWDDVQRRKHAALAGNAP